MDLVNDTIGTMLTKRAADTPDGIGLQYNGEVYTWQEIDDIASQLCHELHETGIQSGDYVGILGSNSAGWILYYFALMKLGAAAVLFSTRFKETEIEKGVQLTQIKALIYSIGYKNESYDQVIQHFQEKKVSIQQFIPMERKEEEWKETAKKGHAAPWNPVADCQSVASILFTSGTTSDSKGVQLTHYNLVNNALAMVEQLHWTKEDTFCVVVPLFHCFGVTACILTSLCSGASMVLMHNFRTLEVCQCIQEQKCTVLSGVPSMFLAMLKNPERINYDISSVRSGIIAGSPIFPEEYQEICKMFDQVKLQPSYGQSEASPCISVADYEDSLECKAHNAGKVIAHVEVRIVHLDTGHLCQPDEIGEIQARGYNVMKGYLGNAKQTEDTITKDGWLKTGDMGCLSKDGYLSVTGRCKNLIIRGGENISPMEIEHAMKEIVKTHDIKVLGIPSAVLQEDIVACVEGPVNPLMKQKLQEHLKKNLSDYKVPKYLYFIKEFPRSGTEKVDEKKLKSEVLKLVKSEKK